MDNAIAGAQHSLIRLHQTRNVGSFKIRAGITAVTSSGLTLSFGGDRSIDKKTRLGMFVECGPEAGVTWRLKFNRAGQKISLPIICSEDDDLQFAVAVFAIPLVSYLLFDRLFIASYRKKKRKELVYLYSP